MTAIKQFEKVIYDLPFPESLHEIHFIKPKEITLDLISRLKCFNCGLWLYARAILCPPYLWQTYSQFKTYKSTKKFFKKFKHAVIFIWKNDGTKKWKINEEELSHITFKKKFGKQLKGTEAGQSRELTKLMIDYRRRIKKKGFRAFGMIPGHCDACGFKCPNRENPPWRHHGMPSLEATGIDVYKLLEYLKVEYEYPVENYLTSVTMFLIRKSRS